MSLGGLISLIGMPASSRVQTKRAEREAKLEPYTPGPTPDLVGLGDLVMGEGEPAAPQVRPQGGTLYQLMHGGWDVPVEREAEISPWKPEQERLFASHEQATLEDVRGSLGAIILGGLAPGLPGITRGGAKMKAPASTRPSIDHSILSPSGGVSKAARARALERVRVELFGEAGLAKPKALQPSRREVLERELSDLQGLLARGMKPKGYRKRLKEIEQELGGEPQLFHGGSPGIKRFQPGRQGGIFFTPQRELAEQYAKQKFDRGEGSQVYGGRLNLKNPLVHDAKKDGPKSQLALIDKAKRGGHDGLIIKNTHDAPGQPGTPKGELVDLYVAFDSGQVSIDPSAGRVLRQRKYE